MAKKFLLLLLSIVFLLSITLPSTAASSIEDDSQDAARELYELGLFQGVGNDDTGNPVFNLEKQPTRHEAVTMLVRLIGKEDEAKAMEYTAPFKDVSDWAKPYVNYAYHNGLTTGVSSDRYGGNGKTTAAQYITFVLRALGYESGTDFRWDRSFELSDRLGITHGEYGTDSEFTRGDVASVSRNALSAKLKNSDKLLRDTCIRIPGDSYFQIHFIDVGEACSTLVICDGHSMLVDGGNASDSQLMYSYLRDHGVSHLDYIICSHPHEDHAGGLAGALNYATVDKVYCSETEYDTKAFNSFVKYLEKQGKSIIVPEAGTSFKLGSSVVQIVGPLHPSDSLNNESLVVRISYYETSFLLTADAETPEEYDILESGYRIKSSVLQVSHHGSSDASAPEFLETVNPEIAVIPVGDNSFGHPTDVTLNKLENAGITVYRTDYNGHIVMTSDGHKVSVSVAKTYTGDKGAVSIVPTDDTDEGSAGNRSGLSYSYILNKNTGVFHYPDCSAVKRMSEKNKIYFEGTRDEAIEEGYRPCQICEP